MARPSKETPAPSALVPAVVRFVRQRDPAGADLLALRLGLSGEAAEAEEVQATASMIEAALESASEVFSEPSLALRLPRDLRFRRYGFAELAARSTPTLRDGFARFARYASLIHPSIECALEEREDEALWIQRTPSHPRGVGRHAHEYALAYVLACARRDTGQPLAATRAWFAHARPPDIAPMNEFFATRELAFGCEDSGFAFPRPALDVPMTSGDPRLLATADDLAEAALRAQPRASTLVAQVTGRVESSMPGGTSIDAVAQAMHMSPRTLQRRLDAEGVSFSDLVDGVRRRVALRWLADESRALSEIAFSLGFSDLATFSRAFKRWTGKPPGAWRRGQ